LNILYITPYKFIPQNGGGKVAMYNQIQNLCILHKVTVASVGTLNPLPDWNCKIIPFFSEGRFRYMNPLYVLKLLKIIKQDKTELIILEHPYMGWMLVLLQLFKQIPFAIRSQNVEYLRFKDLGKWWYKIMAKYEKFIHDKAKFVLCITEDDKLFFEKQGVRSKLINYPFGTNQGSNPSDRKECNELVIAENKLSPSVKIILFNGSLSYLPNKTGLDIILEKINPILLEKLNNYKIIICGGGLDSNYENLKQYVNKNIIYKGFVDDISIYFKAADLFINPVQGGGGIKTKLIDALAYGTTAISSENGANGVVKATVDHKLFITADYDAEAMAEKIIDILNETNYTPTPQSFYDYYNWTKITKRISEQMKLLN
jgi:polysaccharide biosynthesis protein PslH